MADSNLSKVYKIFYKLLEINYHSNTSLNLFIDRILDLNVEAINFETFHKSSLFYRNIKNAQKETAKDYSFP